MTLAMHDDPSTREPIVSPVRLRSGNGGFYRLNIVIGALSVPLFLVVWELISRSGIVNIVLFPPPSVVAVAVLEWIRSGQFFWDLLASLYRVTCGFVIGATLGVFLGILTGEFALVSSFLSPLFHILRPIPPIAFVPIVILWFGLSETGKLFLVVWGVFFTVWLATHIGVQKVDRGLIRAAMMLGTPRRRMLQEIIFLGALPYIVVGLRTAVSIAFYALVAAELAGTFVGIVYRIEIAQQNMQTGQAMGGLAALGLVSFLADRLFATLAERIVWWR
jgi:ABC-type nitrate/sulfonate/bicarbonate transport system permease component